MTQLTPKARAALEWFAATGPIGWFGMDAPSDAMRRRLLKDGLIEKVTEPYHGCTIFRVIKFQISATGRRAITDPGNAETHTHR